MTQIRRKERCGGVPGRRSSCPPPTPAPSILGSTASAARRPPDRAAALLLLLLAAASAPLALLRATAAHRPGPEDGSAADVPSSAVPTSTAVRGLTTYDEPRGNGTESEASASPPAAGTEGGGGGAPAPIADGGGGAVGAPTSTATATDAAASSSTMNSTARASSIPRRLVFTYKSNLLQTRKPHHFYFNVKNTIDKYREYWGEPHAPVLFLDDDGCASQISAARPRLLRHFHTEKKGKFKADVCRVAALYNGGGYYFDVDMRVLKAVNLSDDTSFASVHSGKQGGASFFQSFMASSPRHPVVGRTLEVIQDYYEGRHQLNAGIMGCSALEDAYNSVSPNERGTVRILSELKLNSSDLYPDLPRQKGMGCCCNYVVHDKTEREVYFFSRIPGSGKYCWGGGGKANPVEEVKTSVRVGRQS